MPTPLDQTRISENANATHSEPNRWYLAYGSNLSSTTFQGRRRVQPLARCNVTVPSLELAFDLPGVPYWEPCFANVRPRDASRSSQKNTPPVLTGVAYLITPADYRKVIASEGGGTAYEETAVECWPIPATHPAPTRAPAPADDAQRDAPDRLIAYTLLAKDSKRRSAPMEPSQRYINIIQSGAREHGLPPPYIAYLDRIPYYQRTGIRQTAGASLFLAMWFPILCVVILLQTAFADKTTGRTPAWLAPLSDAVSSAMWRNYERVWKRMIGSGEVTEGHAHGLGASSIMADDNDDTGKGKEAGTETSVWDTPTDAVKIPLLYRRGTGA
ncbi:hypothetical protein JB92DRAFT_2908822 [Gautieria morchelliformis]|nr:hypothetical protein JB92DRAFT_2908822 [Gautieria morchelliformis]